MKLIKENTEFCPVCNNKLRTHSVSSYVKCIEVLIEKMVSHETNSKLASHERN